MRYTDADLVVAVPMLGRPHRVEPTVRTIRNTVPRAHIVFGLTETDTEVIDEVQRRHEDHLVLPPNKVGDYAKKVNMIFKWTNEPLIFTGACDLKFHPGWFENATELLSGTVHVVGTQDLLNEGALKGIHSTHSLITREYVNSQGLIDGVLGKLLCEEYIHEYVDDELVQTAKHRGAFAFCGNAIVEHLHPGAGKAPMDSSYAAAGWRTEMSEEIYKTRSKLWAST